MTVLLCWVVAVAAAFAISFALRSFVFEIVRVNGDAMHEALVDGDLVLVTKFDYREQSPKRGDIVAANTSGGVILRRVVGMPGETVELTDGQTLIGGEPFSEFYVSLKNYDSFAAKTLPPGYYYVLGDNRTVAYDSRDDAVGLVAEKSIVGRACMVLWPLNHLTTF